MADRSLAAASGVERNSERTWRRSVKGVWTVVTATIVAVAVVVDAAVVDIAVAAVAETDYNTKTLLLLRSEFQTALG